MDKISLSAADICRIIKQCHASEVSEFNFQGMSFKFHPRRNGDADKLGPASDHIQLTLPVVSDFPEAGSEQIKMFDEENMLDAEEAQLLIDDPYAFEKVQMDRHIERARTHEKT